MSDLCYPMAASMRWTHPRLGLIVEDLCERHQRELLAALSTLGIGCSGERSSSLARDCDRCLNEDRNRPVREYLTGQLDPDRF